MMDFLSLINANNQPDGLKRVENKLNELVNAVNRLADLLESNNRDTSEDDQMVAFDVVKKDKTIYVTRGSGNNYHHRGNRNQIAAPAEDAESILKDSCIYTLETNTALWIGKPDLTFLENWGTGWFRMEFLRDNDGEKVIGLVSAAELANIVMAYEKSRPDPILLGVASKGGSLTLKVFGDY